MKSTQSNRLNDKSANMLNDKSAKMPSTRKTNQQPQHEDIKVQCRVADGSTRSTSIHLTFFNWWLGVYIHGQCDIRVHGLRSLDHWLWFHPPIESLRCIIVFRVIVDGSLRHRWWSCWQAQRTSVSKRWNHRVHDQLTRTGKRTYGLYTRSLRLDGTNTWGGTPHVSKVASPVIRRGATVPTDCRVVLQLKAGCFIY